MDAGKISPKKFLLIYFVVYLVISAGWVAIYKSPAFSAAYIEEYGEDHERYLEIVKSDPYKHYEQRPHLIEQYYERHPQAILSYDELVAGVAFVEEYTARPAYQAEAQRTARYNLFFEFFNALAVAVLVGWFGWRPLMRFLDQQVDGVRARIGRAENRRKAAVDRLEAAKAQLDGLEEERERIREQAMALAETERATAAEMTERVLAQVEQEASERAELERVAAAQELRAELILQAAEKLEEELRRGADEATQDQMVHEFAEGLRAHIAAGGRTG